MPDGLLGAKIGRTKIAVQRKRQSKGIPSHKPWRRDLSASEQKKIGKADDTTVAKALGVSRIFVARYRAKNGIPAYGKSQ
ncbi:MAG: hypothetical protein QM811_06835 [Pirellulales bacterium]